MSQAEIAIIGATVTRDPAGDVVVATAVAVQADLIVSRDAHLLDLMFFRQIPFVSPAEALLRISAAP